MTFKKALASVHSTDFCFLSPKGHEVGKEGEKDTEIFQKTVQY